MKKCLSFFTAALFLTPLILMFSSCTDPVFYTISREVAPIDPRIKGAPTNFVIFDGRMYTASGVTLFSYNEEEGWNKSHNPGGNILQLAVTNDYLYALCNRDDVEVNTVIKRYDKSEWIDLGTDLVMESSVTGRLQSIYAAGGKLFGCVEYYSIYDSFFNVIYVDEEVDPSIAIKNLFEISEDSEKKFIFGEVKGAASNGASYYICTNDRGIIKTEDPSLGAVYLSGGEGYLFTGIISLETDVNTIVAITRAGLVFTVGDETAIFGNLSMGTRMSTGALAIWRDEDGVPKLLLVGRQDILEYTTSSGFTYGYMELSLDSNGINADQYVEPGRTYPSSILDGDNEQYKSTIGKYPVNHLFQAPIGIDSKRTLFASTQKSGVFSYRDRNPWQWNAEE